MDDIIVTSVVSAISATTVIGVLQLLRSVKCRLKAKEEAEIKKQVAEFYRKAAEKEQREGQTDLRPRFRKSQEVSTNDPQPPSFLQYAAQRQAAEQYNLGMRYQSGNGLPQDHEQAVNCYIKAAEQGLAEAQTILGACYTKGIGVPKDYEQAIKWFRKAAEQGHAEAQYILGRCYYEGQGVPQDYGQAIVWYSKAAAQGEPGAQRDLGMCYAMGVGLPEEDYEKAVHYFLKAAEQGDAEAQYHLAACYRNGDGVPMDSVLSYMWLNLAGRTVWAARNERDAIAKKMTPEQIAEAQRLSSAWKPKIGAL